MWRFNTLCPERSDEIKRRTQFSLQRWNSRELIPGLQLPPLNEFIPEDLTIYSVYKSVSQSVGDKKAR